MKYKAGQLKQEFKKYRTMLGNCQRVWQNPNPDFVKLNICSSKKDMRS